MIVIELKELRKSKGLTLVQLSRISGVSTATLCNIENGYKTPKVDNLFYIAKALGVTLNDLVKEVRAVDYYCG